MGFPTVAWDDVPRITGSQMQQLIMLATGKYGPKAHERIFDIKE